MAGANLGFDNDPACGTAACIAGFAGALTARGRMEDDVVHLLDAAVRTGHGWNYVLAGFLGVDALTARSMVSVDAGWGIGNGRVRPRHAVRLLDTFLETGEVDWVKAMGRKRAGGRITSTAAERAMAKRDRAAVKAARAAA